MEQPALLLDGADDRRMAELSTPIVVLVLLLLFAELAMAVRWGATNSTAAGSGVSPRRAGRNAASDAVTQWMEWLLGLDQVRIGKDAAAPSPLEHKTPCLAALRTCCSLFPGLRISIAANERPMSAGAFSLYFAAVRWRL